MISVVSQKSGLLPSRELTHPTLGKGKSSSKNAILGGYVNSLEGTFLVGNSQLPNQLIFAHDIFFSSQDATCRLQWQEDSNKTEVSG